MASLRGLEPPTSWFVATRSIQLSYRLSLGILARSGGSTGFDDLVSDDLVRSQMLYPAELRAHRTNL